MSDIDKQTTAMQELIEYIDNNYNTKDSYIISCFAKSFLPKEKEQILQAHLDGQYCNVNGEESIVFSNEYFNKQFKQ